MVVNAYRSPLTANEWHVGYGRFEVEVQHRHHLHDLFMLTQRPQMPQCRTCTITAHLQFRMREAVGLFCVLVLLRGLVSTHPDRCFNFCPTVFV